MTVEVEHIHVSIPVPRNVVTAIVVLLRIGDVHFLVGDIYVERSEAGGERWIGERSRESLGSEVAPECVDRSGVEVRRVEDRTGIPDRESEAFVNGAGAGTVHSDHCLVPVETGVPAGDSSILATEQEQRGLAPLQKKRRGWVEYLTRRRR